MKKITKLMTTGILLLIGALVSFGASLNEDEYNDIIKSKNAQEFVDKLENKERFNNFAKMAEEKNPEMAEKIQQYVKDHKGKHLKNLDKEQLQEAFRGTVTGFKEDRVTSSDLKTKATKSNAKAKTDTKDKETKATPKSNAKADAGSKMNTNKEVKTKTKLDSKAETKKNPKSNAEKEVKAKAKSDSKAEAKNPKSTTKKEVKTKTKSNSKTEAKNPKAKTNKEVKSKTKLDSKAKTKKDTKSNSKKTTSND